MWSLEFSPEFKPMPETDIWLPLQPDPNSNNNGHYLRVAARLKSGVSLEPANAQLNIVGEEYRRQFPEWLEKQESIAAVPMQEELSSVPSNSSRADGSAAPHMISP